MTCITASDLTLIENFEQYLKRELNARDLGELAGHLARLKTDLPVKAWLDLCRRVSHKKLLAPHEGLLAAWETTLPSVQGRQRANSLFAFEIREVLSIIPRARILALGGTHLNPVNFAGADQAHFAYDRHLEDTMLRGRSAATAEGFDFIYTSEWLNQSSDACAIDWLTVAAGLLRGGGRLLASNLMPNVPDAAYLEARWNIWPIYRDEQDLANLASHLSEQKLRGHAVFRDDAATMTFLEIQAV